MAILIVAFHVIVVVFPIPRAGIVWRVDIDCIHLAAMGKGQSLQRVEILTIDDGVKWLVTAALDLPGADKTGLDVVPELGHHAQIDSFRFGALRLIGTTQ